MLTIEQNKIQSSPTPTGNTATPAPQPTVEELRTQREELNRQLWDINHRLKPIERREQLVEFALLKQVFGNRHRLEIKIGFHSDGKEARADVGIFTDESAPVHLSISPKMSRAEACGCLLKIIARIESEHGEQLWQRTAEVTETVLSDANFPEPEYPGDDVPF